MEFSLALVYGDGIGPEIVQSAVGILNKVGDLFGDRFYFTEVTAGGASIDRFGLPLLDEELKKCKSAQAVLFGAVGGPKWDALPADIRPERALLRLREELGLFANIRPALLYGPLAAACPLKDDATGGALDLVVVRELTGGIYFGERGRKGQGQDECAFDVMRYSVPEIERIGRVGFETAMRRSRRLTSVDKANVLECSRLWREVMHRLHKEYPDVQYSDMLVDNCAMQLIRNPGQFDVIVTENMFGDILSDEASMLTGSIGMLPSASLGSTSFGMYEPIHGSAPDLAGKDAANPIATILSAAMLMRYSLDLPDRADVIESAVQAALAQGARTADIADKNTPHVMGTREMTKCIAQNLTR